MEEPNNESTNNQDNRQDGDSDEALLVFRPIDLLPYDKRQPGLKHISHFVHASDDQGPLLVIFRAYLMRPSVMILLVYLRFDSLGNCKTYAINRPLSPYPAPLIM